jgi:tyrosyl-tRNA synthetase
VLPAPEQLEILRRGVHETIDEKDLLAKLERSIATGVPLRIKLGVDPTAPDIHLGFTVVMRKLRQFQDLGHQVVLIVGDYTATVGDPSGKSKTRPRLGHEEVLRNAETYKEQFFRIVDRERTEVVYNGEWFKTLTFDKVTELMSRITVARMLEREDFANRYASGQPISLHEFLYPMMQGYDSVQIRADVELGGTDQKFNVLRGRELQRDVGQEPQVGMFLPILLGTDGQTKMSKSFGNYVGITEAPQVMYHKIYSIPDSLVESWTTLLTDLPEAGIQQRKARLAQEPSSINEWKAWLASDIVRQYHGQAEAEAASAREAAVHRGDALPDDTPEFTRSQEIANILDLLVACGAVPSRGEGKKLLQNGGVQIDSEKVVDPNATLSEGEFVLRAGKRRFWKVKAA